MLKLIIPLVLFIFLTGCSGSYFNTVNDMQRVNAVIIKNDGTEILGQVSFRGSTRVQHYVTVVPSGSKEKQRVPITDIQSLEVRGNRYVPRPIEKGGLHLAFLKPLTRDDSRLTLYEYYEQDRRSDRTYRGYPYTRNEDLYVYYLEVPGRKLQEPVWELSGRKLVPNFDDKMSEVVKDCPELAEKIRNREKGYFYAQISTRDRVEIMQNIINEYNRCGN